MVLINYIINFIYQNSKVNPSHNSNLNRKKGGKVKNQIFQDYITTFNFVQHQILIRFCEGRQRLL